MTQAGIGTSYLQNIVVRTAREFLHDHDMEAGLAFPMLALLRFRAMLARQA